MTKTFDPPRLTVIRCPAQVTRRIQPAGYGPRPLRWRNGIALRILGRLVLICRHPRDRHGRVDVLTGESA